MTKSSTGLEENVAGLLSYVLTWLTGLIFFLIEKDSNYVKFHAMQSIITFAGLMILSWVLAIIPFLGWVISMLINILMLALWIILMIKSYKGERYKLPVIGDIAEKWSGTA